MASAERNFNSTQKYNNTIMPNYEIVVQEIGDISAAHTRTILTIALDHKPDLLAIHRAVTAPQSVVAEPAKAPRKRRSDAGQPKAPVVTAPTPRLKPAFGQGGPGVTQPIGQPAIQIGATQPDTGTAELTTAEGIVRPY